MTLVDNFDGSSKLEALPLYARVRAKLVERLISGFWKPGAAIPSEIAIANELGVHQGTVRKALDTMTKDGLIVRRQGRGTFVADAEDQAVLFRFYRLTRNGEESQTSFPKSTYLSQVESPATEIEQHMFDLDEGEKVWTFTRLRSDTSGPILWERLVLPSDRFPDFSASTQLPNNVYHFYGSHYGIIVAKVNEELRAVTGSKEICDLLEIPNRSPLLEIDRRARALDGQIVEWRVSLCRSDTMHYRNELS